MGEATRSELYNADQVGECFSQDGNITRVLHGFIRDFEMLCRVVTGVLYITSSQQGVTWILLGVLGLSELDKDDPVGEGGGQEGCHQAPVDWEEATG